MQNKYLYFGNKEMNKKISFLVLIVFTVYSICGCYISKTEYLKNTSKEEYKWTEKVDLDEELYVLTKDHDLYFFAPYTFKFKEDTLIGSAQKVIIEKKGATELVKIPLKDIIQKEQKELEPVGTFILGALVTSIFLFIIWFSWAASAIN